MLECQNKIEVRDVSIPPWTTPVPGMQVIQGDIEDQHRIQYTPDIVYVTRHRPLHMQLFTHWTPTPGKRYPVVLHVRGSGWKKQDVYGFLPQLTDIARAGYVVASIEYRDTEEGCGFPAQIEDAKAAIHFLKDNAERFDIDPDRIAVMGDSSGGHTALMTGYAGVNELCAESERDMDLSVRCVVDVFGPSDFTDAEIAAYPCGVDNVGPDSPLNLLIRHALYPFDDIRAAMSPINWISPEKRLPPTLIVHGDRDNMCPFPHSVALYKKLCACGQSADFIMVRNALHGTRIWIPAVMDAILAFLKAHL